MMFPAWQFWSLVGLNIVMGIGWGLTIGWSMKRALHMYEFGRQNGIEQGRLECGPQRKKSRR